MAARCHGTTVESSEYFDRDAELMLRAKHDDHHAFEALFRQHRASVQRFVRRMLGSAAEAEDVTQEIFLRAFRYRANYEVTAKFTTWLYRIAGHVTLNWIRDHSRTRSQLPLEPAPGTRLNPHLIEPTIRIDEWIMFQTKLARVQAAIDELPERQRAIVRLHKFEELDCEEIARQLGCSNQAVRSVLCRAYSTLRERLDPY